MPIFLTILFWFGLTGLIVVSIYALLTGWLLIKTLKKEGVIR